MDTISNGQIFLYETLGTAMLLLFGCGVVANAILAGTKGLGGGWLLINFGWGLGVYAGVYTAFPTGAHLNPAVTVSQWMMGNVTAGQVPFYFLGEFLGAFLGAVLTWLAYKQHFDPEEDPGLKLAVFSTGPAIRSYSWNFITEVIGTFVLIFVILISGGTPTQVGPLFVALLVIGIGDSLGGPDRLRHQPGPRPRSAHRPRRSADQGQGFLGLGLLVGARRRPDRRRRPRHPAVPGDRCSGADHRGDGGRPAVAPGALRDRKASPILR